jgi:hypothetical protein
MKHLKRLARRVRYWLRFARDGWGLRYSWWMAVLATDICDVPGNDALPPPF